MKVNNQFFAYAISPTNATMAIAFNPGAGSGRERHDCLGRSLPDARFEHVSGSSRAAWQFQIRQRNYGTVEPWDHRTMEPYSGIRL